MTDQFLSVDPDLAETGQPYAFTGDDPLNATDPLGLSSAAAAYRERLLEKTSNDDLRSILEYLYRKGASIGNGGPADALKSEVEHSEYVVRAGGEISFTHFEKATGGLKNLSKLIKSKVLGPGDQEIAIQQAEQLRGAVQTATSRLDNIYEVAQDLGFSAVKTAAQEGLVSGADRILSYANEVLDTAGDAAGAAG